MADHEDHCGVRIKRLGKAILDAILASEDYKDPAVVMGALASVTGVYAGEALYPEIAINALAKMASEVASGQMSKSTPSGRPS